MSKKKRQGDPNANSDDSSDTSDVYRNVAECTHIAKSVDLNRIKKAILKTFHVECENCKKNPVQLDENPLMEFDTSLWMCLKCGNQACGRSINEHALLHYQVPRSDSHSLCVNTSRWCVWCYECDAEVNITCKKKLLECVEYLKKLSEGGKRKIVPNITVGDKMIDVIDNSIDKVSESALQPKTTTIILDLPKARGLSNLGNTCFFNSVMQCLGQTPHLLKLLEETSTPGQYFNLPGGKLVIDEKQKETINLDPLDGTLEEWRPLTRVLAETLRELQNGRSEVHNPRILLSRLTQRMPQFGGGDQHDSHELLRHLLEAVREEDLRRYQSIILQKLGLSIKTDPASVEGEKKKIIRFYGGQASELLLPTEQVFRGVLVSTLQCQDCGHTSHRDEFFLDLSLPISEKQTPPVLRRKAEDIDDKPSKHQLKKEKRQAKKNKKSRAVFRVNNTVSNPMDVPAEGAAQSESESDADIEDNIEDSNNVRSSDDVPSKGTESGYNSDKNGDKSPENLLLDWCVDDSGVPSPAVGMLSVSPIGPAPVGSDSSVTSSETNIDIGQLCGRNTPNEEGTEEFERPQSRLSFVNNKSNDLKSDLEKLSLKNENKNAELGDRLKGAYGGFDEDEDDEDNEDEDEKMHEEDTEDMWCGTISARYNIEDGECSVQSCLNQFTTSELMTANNKVSCELCTKRHGGPEKKTVYTNARKQLLIYNPPAVLILHLKRFQVYHLRPVKMSKYVKFPIVLDIAPFCSKRSKNLPTFDAGQTKVLYSLYGVVEHSGTMHGGHYVAYVKVRPKLEEDSYRWSFLPKNQKKNNKGSPKKDHQPEVPPGKWYYISDSHASEVSESRVLDANAYLLFYERIL